MKLERWALIAEIASAVAVVSSLVFVGFQVRQGAEQTALNTRAIQANAYQELTALLSQVPTLVIENSDLAEAFSSADRGEPPQSDLAKTKLRQLVLLIYRYGDMAFVQYQNGLINESQLQSMLAPVMRQVQSEFGRQIWENHRGLSPEFKSYVKQQLAD
jgi:hypothetical protein